MKKTNELSFKQICNDFFDEELTLFLKIVAQKGCETLKANWDEFGFVQDKDDEFKETLIKWAEKNGLRLKISGSTFALNWSKER